MNDHLERLVEMGQAMGWTREQIEDMRYGDLVALIDLEATS